MSRFPRPQAEIAALAASMIAGLMTDPETFPDPPVAAAELASLHTAYIEARNRVVAAESFLGQALADKDDRLATLVGAMKRDLRYAENAGGGEDGVLKSLGWGGRRARTALEPPSQTMLLVVREQGEGWVRLAWKPPVEGGRPSVYRIVRREQVEGRWSDVGLAVVCEAVLADQPAGRRFEYRVLAVNRAGEGEPSNTVMVVL